MTVPVTLKETCRVKPMLGRDETRDARMAGRELIRPGKAVIREVVTAVLCDGVIDEDRADREGSEDVEVGSGSHGGELPNLKDIEGLR